MTLDQNVPLDVAVDELAVHEPDYKHLIAFLKAMEFTTITRRIAEKSGIDASAIEADANAGGVGFARSRPSWPGLTRPSMMRRRVRRPAVWTPGSSPAVTVRAWGRRRRAGALTPIALATARSEAARTATIDRSKYECVRTLDAPEGMDRARA